MDPYEKRNENLLRHLLDVLVHGREIGMVCKEMKKTHENKF